jgi:hypothetical protein
MCVPLRHLGEATLSTEMEEIMETVAAAPAPPSSTALASKHNGRLTYLRIALIAVGLTFMFGIYPLGVVWPSGWTWGHGHSHYLMMIIGVYATLGAFLLLAARNPEAHKSLIWFTVWSSVVHGGIMAVQALGEPMERGHLIGDVSALFLVAIVLAASMPRTSHPR